MKCECCNGEAKFSILVSQANDRLYLPNQSARSLHKERELWLCHSCMRFIEDNFRAIIDYLKKEGGLRTK